MKRLLRKIQINGQPAIHLQRYQLNNCSHLPWIWTGSTSRSKPIYNHKNPVNLLYNHFVMEIPSSWILKPKVELNPWDVNPFKYAPTNGYNATYRDFLSDEVKILIDVIPYYSTRKPEELLHHLPAFTLKQIEEALKHV